MTSHGLKGGSTMRLVPAQEEGVEFLINRRGVILADEMGSGKTAQVLTAVQRLAYNYVLAVTPGMVKRVWVDEAAKWAPDWTVRVIEGSEAERVRDIEETMPPKCLVVINYEQLRLENNKPKPTLAALRRQPWEAVILDEAHYVKNRTTQRFKALRLLLSGRGCSVYCLTGTPIVNSPGDIWTLLHLCDKYKFPHFWPWVSKHAELRPNPFSRTPLIVGVRDPMATQEELKEFILRRPKTAFVDLPPRTVTELSVELLPKQRKAYREMKATGFAEGVSASSVLAKVTRLRQICVADELITGETPLLGTKLDVAQQLCEDAGTQQVVIFSNYVEAAEEMARRTGGITITGQTPQQDRQARLDFFKNGKTRVLAMTLGVGGVGIDLSCASVAIFLDVSWSPAVNAQAADRLHRPGQSRPVTVYVLTAESTIEEKVMQVLQHKDKLFDATVPGVPTETLIKLLKED